MRKLIIFLSQFSIIIIIRKLENIKQIKFQWISSRTKSFWGSQESSVSLHNMCLSRCICEEGVYEIVEYLLRADVALTYNFIHLLLMYDMLIDPKNRHGAVYSKSLLISLLFSKLILTLLIIDGDECLQYFEVYLFKKLQTRIEKPLTIVKANRIQMLNSPIYLLKCKKGINRVIYCKQKAAIMEMLNTLKQCIRPS
jgi:hypothetical protein